jgi:hypothetical protein
VAGNSCAGVFERVSKGVRAAGERVDGTLRRSERDRSDGGTASPVAEDLAGVREGERGRESSGNESWESGGGEFSFSAIFEFGGTSIGFLFLFFFFSKKKKNEITIKE